MHQLGVEVEVHDEASGREGGDGANPRVVPDPVTLLAFAASTATACVPGGGLPYVEGVLSQYDAACTLEEPPFVPVMEISATAEWFACDGGYTRVEDQIVEIWQQYVYDPDGELVAADEEQFLGIPIACCSGTEVPIVIQGMMPDLTGCVPIDAPTTFDTGVTGDTGTPPAEPPVGATADTGAPRTEPPVAPANRGCGCGGVAPSWIALPLLVLGLRRRPG